MARDKTLVAYLAQGNAWREALESNRQLQPTDFGGALLIGSGTSYYLAQAVSWIGQQQGLGTSAAPSCEVMLYPDHYLSGISRLVMFSRSARTTEAGKAAEAARARGIPTTLITCNPSTNDFLYKFADEVILSPSGDDGGVVMLRSFTSMLILALAALHPEQRETLLKASYDIDKFAADALTFFRGVISENVPERVVFLGGGPLYGIAREAALKMTEMALTVAESFHPLEYRHGPIATLDPGDVMVLFAQSETWEDEHSLIDEAKSFGAKAISVPGSDLSDSLMLPDSLVSIAMPAALAVVAQGFSLAVAEAKGIECDRPQHLRGVVELPSK
ncbi:SIS domain-containing protein [Alicyclobacillus curvatus]|nr:SIS domain-containing protein [Alicyclobacillus curvatus]